MKEKAIPSTPLPPNSQAVAAPAARTSAAERVVEVLSGRIRSGLYGAGEPLPPERELAASLGVHRRSVRAATHQLIRDGLVSQRPNCRPTVGPSAAEVSAPQSHRPPTRLSASNLIALVMWHGGGPLEYAGSSQQRIFWGMNQALIRRGYHTVFLDLGGEQMGTEQENAAREAEHLHYIRDHGFGGVVFYPYAYRSNSELVQEVSRTVPLVMLDRKISGVVTDFVGIKNQAALAEVTNHLILQGHRRIAHLTRWEPIHSVQGRVQGYIDAMRGADVSGLTEMILALPPYSPGNDDRRWWAVEAAFRLPKEQRPTAVTCMSDYVAVSLAEHLHFLGLSIPGDVALTGFDGIVPALPGGIGLTTLAQPYEQMGSAAVELLMRRIKNPEMPPQSVELSTKLIARASSASLSLAIN